MQIKRLHQASNRFQGETRQSNRIVDATGTTPLARTFTNELAEIRKMEKMIFTPARLEQSHRLKTVTELGDVAVTSPSGRVIGDIKAAWLQSAHRLRRS
jgi:division protein CdvB (Snf7/Vps24/ESCRT-III family)